MQKTLIPLWNSEDDQFADNSQENVKEVNDTSLSSVSIGGRPLCNLRFTDDIDLLGGSEEELQQFTERLDKIAAGCGISSDKSKILLNSIKPRPSATIWINGEVKKC